MTPTHLFHFAGLSALPTVWAFNGGFTALPICFSAFQLWSASVALPDNPFTMPSADSPSRFRGRGLPGFSRLLSMRNCRIYVIRLLITGGLPVVLHPRPCVSRLISDFCSSARMFAAGLLKGSLRKTPLPLATLRRYLPVAGLAL